MQKKIIKVNPDKNQKTPLVFPTAFLLFCTVVWY